jgi:PAS domain S-box-containing protein
VTESDQAKSDVALEDSILDSAIPLESILRTEELYRRPSRPPDYQKENRALVALVSALADSPHTILQRLAEKVLDVLQADSAGLSLLTKDEKRFYWAAIAGAWRPHIGGGTPRDSGPCGDVLDRNIPMLFTHWERRYPYLRPATPLAEEGLLVPFCVNGKAVGTIWAIAHTNHRNFDAEDLRLLESLGRFASAAYQAVASIDDLKFQIAEREKAETALQELAKGLEAKVRRLVDSNIIGIVIWNLEGQIIEANEAFLRMVGYDREDLLSGRVSWREVTPDKWRAADEQALAELAATGVCEPFEKEYFRKDGSRVPVLVGAALLEGSENEGVAFVLDLSAQKRSEAALRRSEYYLAEAQRLSHTGSWAFNVATREIVHWSQEHFRIFGFDSEDGMPSFETLMQRIHPDDRARASEGMERGIRDRTDYEQDFRIVLPDGTIRYLHATRHPVFNSSGDPVEFVGTVVDVTERKRAEEERQAHLWFLESMDRVNRSIQGTSDLEQMMSDVLDAVLSIFNCDRAWLVYPCDPEAASWKVPMEHARPEFPGAFALGLDLPMDSDVARVFQTVRAASSPVRFDPESEHPLLAETAKRFSIQSFIAMAVYPKGDKPYMLGLHQCSHPRIWKPEEERLFQEIGRRLEDALTSLLMLRNLRESERYLDEAQRLAHLGHWEHDLDTGVTTWSDETYRIFGLIPQECIISLSQFPELVHPEDRQIVVQALEDAFRGGPRYDVEYRAVRPNGEVRFVHSQGDVIRDESGRPRRMFGMVQDITQRRSADEQLRRSQAYLTEAQRLSHTGSWAWNVSTGGVFWSREIYRIFGLDPEQTSLNIDLIKKLRHPEDRALAEQTLEGAVRERRDFEFESRIVLPDGSIRHVRSVGRPVVNDAGVLVEFVGAVMDVTEGKTREEALRKSQAALAHVTRVATLGEMSASIAHEVNQPLAAVVTSASACLRWLDAQRLEEARRSAARAIAEGHRASEIIGRIRALAKKSPPQKDWLDVNETIHDVIALARSEIQRNGVALETQLSDDVPVILADRIQLQQVILNLMMNAIEAMSGLSEGPRELLVRSGTDESKNVVISVQDSGPGFDPRSLEHLFDAFYTTKPHGLGMGLAISRSIIDAHGGRLWVTANAPRGAVFQFILPVGSG